MNNLNQYTSREVPGAVDVLGLALGNNSSLTVNSAAPWRKGEYFRKEVSVANSSVAVWQAIAVAATGETTVNGNVFVPKTPENYTYDDDGNLTQDGRWDYTWDAENRLVKLVSKSGAPSGSEKAVAFTYDAKSRRISKTVSNWVSGAWQLESTNRFVYDGWNLIVILSSSSTIQSAFVWGLDLSGTLQGAGGVGGLLMFTNSGNGAHFCAYDGNGNVAALVKASDGTVSANYEYGPFGEALRVTGTMGKANPFRFSTKYQDDESDFLYYGYRSYNPSVGRWLSRDPIGEKGGLNNHALLENQPIGNWDYLGLAKRKCSEAIGKFGTPRIVYDPAPPKGGWKLARFEFIQKEDEDDTYDGIAMMSGVKVKWRATVAVLCRCSDGCFETRHGTRVHDATVAYEFLAYQAGGMPVNIPSPTTLAELIGEALAEVVDAGFEKPLSMTPEDFRELASRVKATKPKKPTDGKWEGGKSPCN